jgi:hypothetical protein
MTQSVRLKIEENLKLTVLNAQKIQTNIAYQNGVIAHYAENGVRVTREEVLSRAKNTVRSASGILPDVQKSKVIVFPAKQASIFLDAIDEIDFKLDFVLPFQSVLIQFSEPTSARLTSFMRNHDDQMELDTVSIGALLLTQDDGKGSSVINMGVLIEKDLQNFRPFAWHSETDDPLPSHPYQSRSGALLSKAKILERSTMIDIKNLAIACIGYINCENVYLHSVESVTPAINAKRERKGKSRLEPYYVCRIRGVQYDSAGNPTGEGAKHGIRYDVRGHFRRMTDGRTTWVRPHQRGLANELYIPKTYVVDKKVMI